MEKTGHWHPIVYEIKVHDDHSLETLRSCPLDFDLPDQDKKGLEGAEYLDKGPQGGEFILGLCEGNHCEARAAWRLFAVEFDCSVCARARRRALCPSCLPTCVAAARAQAGKRSQRKI
jgi:hypothetical protein